MFTLLKLESFEFKSKNRNVDHRRKENVVDLGKLRENGSEKTC